MEENLNNKQKQNKNILKYVLNLYILSIHGGNILVVLPPDWPGLLGFTKLSVSAPLLAH